MDAKQIENAQIALRQYISPIAKYLDDPNVQEIMINSPGDIWVESNGRSFKTDIVLTEGAVRAAIVLLGRLDGKDVKEGTEHAIIDTRMGMLRVAAALSPTARHGHAICIRKHSAREITLDEYQSQVVSFKTTHVITPEKEPPRPSSSGHGIAAWLSWMVRSRKNVAVSGGTSTGKTSFLNGLLQHIPDDERVVVLEDVSELKTYVPNKVQLETNIQAGIHMAGLVKLSLRFRPDRIIVGELRGAEAYDFMQAMNTGHDGGFCSIHANTAELALSRLEALVLQSSVNWPILAIKSQIASTINYVIQMGRTKGQRHIAEIIKIKGINDNGYIVERIFDFNSLTDAVAKEVVFDK